MGILLSAATAPFKLGKVAWKNPKASLTALGTYVGWDKLFSDKGESKESKGTSLKKDGVVGVGAGFLFGEDRANYYKEQVDDITGYKKKPDDQPSQQQSVQQPAVAQDAYGAFSAQPVSPQMGQSQETGMLSMLSQMVGGFANNLFHGNVNTSSAVGMIASFWLMFSRFGIWAKLGGALLSAMIMSNNSQPQQQSQQQQPSLTQNNGLTQQPPLDVADGYGMRR